MQVYNTLSDDELMALLGQGDHAVFTEVYNRFYDYLFIYAFRISGDRDDSEV